MQLNDNDRGYICSKAERRADENLVPRQNFLSSSFQFLSADHRPRIGSLPPSPSSRNTRPVLMRSEDQTANPALRSANRRYRPHLASTQNPSPPTNPAESAALRFPVTSKSPTVVNRSIPHGVWALIHRISSPAFRAMLQTNGIPVVVVVVAIIIAVAFVLKHQQRQFDLQ